MPHLVLRRRAFARTIASLGLPAVASAAAAQGASSAAPAPSPRRITDKLRRDAAALEPLVTTDLARRFLAATSRLAEPSARTVYRNRDKGLALSRREHEARSAAMPAKEKASFTPREFPPTFCCETAYGSPLVCALVLDLAAPHARLAGRPKLLDFGYGTIGQLHLLAHCGFGVLAFDVRDDAWGPRRLREARLHRGQDPRPGRPGVTVLVHRRAAPAGHLTPRHDARHPQPLSDIPALVRSALA